MLKEEIWQSCVLWVPPWKRWMLQMKYIKDQVSLLSRSIKTTSRRSSPKLSGLIRIKFKRWSLRASNPQIFEKVRWRWIIMKQQARCCRLLRPIKLLKQHWLSQYFQNQGWMEIELTHHQKTSRHPHRPRAQFLRIKAYRNMISVQQLTKAQARSSPNSPTSPKFCWAN